MTDATRPQAATLQALPPLWPDDLLPDIRRLLDADHRKVWVLDDDPTGTQTVANIPVLTFWSVATLVAEFRNELPACYLLTNTRSMPLAAAQARNTEIGQNIVAAAQITGRRYVVISRSDSTLRGHFPGEVDALTMALGGTDATLLVPAFFEGGRYTINDIHYVREEHQLIPVAQTVFARDAVFGYRSSNLRAWVEEKTNGRIPMATVESLSIQELRTKGPHHIAERLLRIPQGGICIVNAADPNDLAVFTLGLLLAEAQERRFLLRTAASMVPIRAGIPPRPLLTHTELQLAPRGGGLVVVGSYVPATSAQLRVLLNQPELARVEVDVVALLDDRRAAEILRVAQQVEQYLHAEVTTVVFTSRGLMRGVGSVESLQIGQHVSAGLVAIVRALTTRPRYLIAKGGITSSDVATQALNVERALTMGQLLPGVPVWQLGPESRYPGLSYIIFPGNVGGPTALADAVHLLQYA